MGCGGSVISAPTPACSKTSLPSYWPRPPTLSRDASSSERLALLLKERPFLEQPDHALHAFLQRCQEAIKQGEAAENEEEAHDALDHLDLQWYCEEQTIAAAFSRFDKNGNGALQGAEIEYMLDYLGFPHGETEVGKFIGTVDRDPDGKITHHEFLHCVGRFGGCTKFLELRRQQIAARGADLEVSEEMRKDDLRCQLLAAGFREEEQATWRPLVSLADLAAAAQLRPCQLEALHHVRSLARANHEQALPELTERFGSLGFPVQDMWMTMAWIRELAPVILHIDLDSITPFLKKDTHYRNQFETKSSRGLLNLEVRTKWERSLFGDAYENAEPFHRPKYGVLNVWNDPQGVYGCQQYGDSYLVLKDVRLRCTLAPQDSGGLQAQRLAVLDFCAHSLLEYSDEELREMVYLAKHGHEKVGDSKAVCQQWGKYKEVQLHGEIDLTKHVERIVIHGRHRKREKIYQDLAQTKGWQISWVEDMEQELEARAEGPEKTREEFDGILERIASGDQAANQAAEQEAEAPAQLS